MPHGSTGLQTLTGEPVDRPDLWNPAMAGRSSAPAAPSPTSAPTFGQGAVPPTQAGDWNRGAVSPTEMPTPSASPTQAAGTGDWIRQLAPLLSLLPLLLRRGGTGETAAFLSGLRESQQERALGQHAQGQETESRRRFEAEFGLRTEENRRAERDAAARNEKDYLEAVAQIAETASEILDETQRQAYLTRMTTLLEQRWPQKRTRQILRDIQASPEAVRKWAQDTLDRFLKTHPSIGEHPDAANVEIQTPLGGKSLSEIMRMAGIEGIDPKTGKPIQVAKPPKEERDPLGTGVSAEAARARIAAFEERHGQKPTAAERAGLLEPPKADTLVSGAAEIAESIINGDQPPTLTGLYRWAGPVRAELARRGFDLKTANLDWIATSRHLTTLNSQQQLRLRQATQFAYESLEIVEDLANQWKGKRLPALNKTRLIAAQQGALGKDAQVLATQLDTQIVDLVAELAVVYRGGYAPTDDALEQAATNLKSSWSAEQLRGNVNLLRRNLQIRLNSIANTPAVTTEGVTAPPANRRGRINRLLR